MPVAPQLRAAGAAGPTGSTGGSSLVWTSEQVALAEWSGDPGLAWDGFGRRLEDIPAPPTSEPNMAISTSAVEFDGRLVLVARSSSGVCQVASCDADERRWTERPSAPEATEPWCPYSAATIGNDLIVQACRALGAGDDDTTDKDQAPFRWAAVWIPDPLVTRGSEVPSPSRWRRSSLRR